MVSSRNVLYLALVVGFLLPPAEAEPQKIAMRTHGLNNRVHPQSGHDVVYIIIERNKKSNRRKHQIPDHSAPAEPARGSSEIKAVIEDLRVFTLPLLLIWLSAPLMSLIDVSSTK